MIDCNDPAVLIALDDDRAVEGLARLARNVPTDVPIGRPLVAAYSEYERAALFLTREGWWWSYPAHAERLTYIGDFVEKTAWYGRVEYERTACRLDELRPPQASV